MVLNICYIAIARLRLHMRHAILFPPRRTSHQPGPFVKHIPSTHSTISACWVPRFPSHSMTPTLSCQGTTGSLSPSTRPNMAPSSPRACTPHDGSRWRPRCPSHGRYCGSRKVPWIGRDPHASEKRRRDRSSASRTRCASSSHSPTTATATTTTGNPRLPRFSLSSFPSISYVFVPRHGPRLRIHSLEYPRPMLLLSSPRRPRPPNRPTPCPNSLHTRNYSTLMET